MTALLTVESLRKEYPGGLGRPPFVAVEGVSFALERGGSLGIVGESGSGKTTTARMLMGLEKPTSGRILFNDRDQTQPPRRARQWRERGKRIQIVFQDPYTSLDRRQSVGDCIAEVVAVHKRGADKAELAARVAELAGLVGLDERQLRARPKALSGGQRQRVAIARALAAEPDVLILDEAVSALDVSIQAQILNLLADIREQTQVSYLFISHDLAVIRQITDAVIVMKNGRVVEAGPTGQVLDDPAEDYTRVLRDSVPRVGWTPTSRRTAATAPATTAAQSAEAIPAKDVTP